MPARYKWCVSLLMAMVCAAAHASVALLMEEPYGEFGAFNPTGHAALYLNHVCAETPTQLRMCRPGEMGVVISRYHHVAGYDWIAMPLVPYLYAVDEARDVPVAVSPAQVLALRDAYRRTHLEAMVPDGADGGIPKGEWIQLMGSSYDREIHGFAVETTVEQDERMIALVNDRANKSHFNLFFNNCADFARVVLDTYYPHSIHRNFIADLGLTTPKQVAKSLVKYGKKHPDLKITAFVIQQVPGTVHRSHGVDGVTESVVKSKRYLLPLAVLQPELAGGVVIAYLMDGRMSLPKDPVVVNPSTIEVPVELPVDSGPAPVEVVTPNAGTKPI